MSWSSGLQPWLRPWAEHLVRHVPGARVTSTYRSYSDQLRLWNARHTNPYPVAPPGRSMHQYGRAWDMVADPAWLRWAGAVWTSWGGRWSEGDRIHFEA